MPAHAHCAPCCRSVAGWLASAARHVKRRRGGCTSTAARCCCRVRRDRSWPWFVIDTLSPASVSDAAGCCKHSPRQSECSPQQSWGRFESKGECGRSCAHAVVCQGRVEAAPYVALTKISEAEWLGPQCSCCHGNVPAHPRPLSEPAAAAHEGGTTGFWWVVVAGAAPCTSLCQFQAPAGAGAAGAKRPLCCAGWPRLGVMVSVDRSLLSRWRDSPWRR